MFFGFFLCPPTKSILPNFIQTPHSGSGPEKREGHKTLYFSLGNNNFHEYVLNACGVMYFIPPFKSHKTSDAGPYAAPSVRGGQSCLLQERKYTIICERRVGRSLLQGKERKKERTSSHPHRVTRFESLSVRKTPRTVPHPSGRRALQGSTF